MKRLILFRHAKAAPGRPGRDVDRPLAERGERDAPRMAARLAARPPRPTLLLTSHARRAARTAELLAHEWHAPAGAVRVDERLYLASPEALLAVVAEQSDAHECVLVVAHNPGLTELANELSPELALDNLPTAGAVAIDLETERWREAASAPTALAYYAYPKGPED